MIESVTVPEQRAVFCLYRSNVNKYLVLISIVLTDLDGGGGVASPIGCTTVYWESFVAPRSFRILLFNMRCITKTNYRCGVTNKLCRSSTRSACQRVATSAFFVADETSLFAAVSLP